MDSLLTHILNSYSVNLLLLPSYTNPSGQSAATSLEQLQACPAEITTGVLTMLRFTSQLLSNATSKHLYSSIPAVSDFLAAANESIVNAALRTLLALSLPAATYKLQIGPDRHHHHSLITQLHQSGSSPVSHSNAANVNGSGKKYRSDVHDRLMCMSKAYGTRTTGHGLYTLVTTDDSIYGQASSAVLPKSFGEIYFTYEKKKKSKSDGSSIDPPLSLPGDKTNSGDDHDDEYDGRVTITLSQSDIEGMPLSDSNSGYVSPSPDHSTSSSDGNIFSATTTTTVSSTSSKKRRKVIGASIATGIDSDHMVNPVPLVQQERGRRSQIKSTAEIFFMIMERVPGGLDSIPMDRWYALLHEIRMARYFYTQNDRCTITMQRLCALITVLHAHPSNDCLSGYFMAQPDIGTDIADLLRPMVSSANISTAPTLPSSNTSSDVPSRNDTYPHSTLRPDAITNLVDDTNHQSVPFELRILAVDAISALITRRDGSTSMGTSSSGRLQSLLIDLGVGKGQYLGLLPTLIRYSLSALSTMVDLQRYSPEATVDTENTSLQPQNSKTPDAFDIGLAFVEATLAPQLSRKIQVQRALRFLDSVLTLTSNVIGTSSGLTTLVDCGLVPALVTTISIDPRLLISNLVDNETDINEPEIRQMEASLRYIMAQSVQLLEPVVVTSSNALATFKDLKGIDVLINRLDYEINKAKMNTSATLVVANSDCMEVEGDETPPSTKDQQKISSSQRSLIFCILTYLTVLFHQESNSESSSIGSAQLRTDELTNSLSHILSNVSVYGGYLVSLVTTLLSDAMNNDPHLVAHVLKSGLAMLFLSMFDEQKVLLPSVPPVPELIMAVPSIISAIALTDDGSKLIAEHNPFPAFLRLFYHFEYAMPRSQCLLNEMATIIGTGLDEIIRHVERLKPLVVAATADAMHKIVDIASDLISREERTLSIGYTLTDEISKLENERSCLIQYILNFSQLLEQFLHNEESCEQFVEAGCFDSVLELSRMSMPPPQQFLPHVSALSAPSVSTLHHSTTDEALSVPFKCLQLRCNTVKVLRRLTDVANRLLDDLDRSQGDIIGISNASFILDNLPQEPVYKLSKSNDQPFLLLISRYLQNVANVQWIISLIANAFKSAYQRTSDSSWNRFEDEWKNEITSDSFAKFIGRLSTYYTATLYEVCRVRATDSYMYKDRQRFITRSSNIRYRLRIVCLEGAVVRDGIEIDSCTNVGSLEMGDIVEASDRCVNASGILRYRTDRGWVSEMTRGHGREPISEVINMFEVEGEMECDDVTSSERIEAGVPDVRSVAVAVLARSQTSCTELFSALSKLVFQGLKTLPVPLPADLASSTVGSYISSLTKILVANFKHALAYEPIETRVNSSIKNGQHTDDAGVALYLGSTLSLLNQCLFDEKRERRSINLPLLVCLLSFGCDEKNARAEEGDTVDQIEQKHTPALEFFRAIGFVLRHGLADFALLAAKDNNEDRAYLEHQRVGQSVASSFPPLILLLRKFTSTPLSSSPVTSIMSRLRWNDVSLLLGLRGVEFTYVGVPGSEEFFHPESLMADLLLCLSKVVFEAYSNDDIRFAPPHIVYPFVGLIGDIMAALKDMSKKKLVKSAASSSGRGRLAELLRQRQPESEPASEQSITRLMEMGFSRPLAQRALQTTFNELESAMDHLLSTAIDRMRSQGIEGGPANEDRTHIQDAIDLEDGPTTSMEVEPSLSLNDAETSSKNITCDILAGNELEAWIKVVPMVICKVLSNIPSPSLRRSKQGSGRIDYGSLAPESGYGDGESEALTVVLCTFLLDMLQNYPEKLSDIVSLVLSHLNGKISAVNSESDAEDYKVEGRNEASFCALCHAVALLTRASPKTRRLVLEMGLVRKILSCLHSTYTAKESDGVVAVTPLWLTPAMLLLDIMAQPIVVFSKEEMTDSMAIEGNDSELLQVQQYHREQLQEISEVVDKWVRVSSTVARPEATSSVAIAAVHTDGLLPSDAEARADANVSKILFSDKIPAYFPLLPQDASQRCVSMCKQILFKLRRPRLSPGLVQSTLLLLLRLLRSPKVASECLRAGMAEAILRLPKQYSFVGSCGVVTLILRRLLEDEPTLLVSMESDIRSAFAKLHSANGPTEKETSPSISLTSLMEATTHLQCRDPLLFFKALVLSVAVAPKSKKLEGSPYVSLQPTHSEAKIKSSDRVQSDYPKGTIATQPHLTPATPNDRNGSRLGRHGDSTKKGKKGKGDTPRMKKYDIVKSPPSDVPAFRIANLLVHSIVSSASSCDVDDDENQFLPIHERIDVLSDLILAAPTCASAVYNHRFNRSKDKHRVSSTCQYEHALQGCPSPPRTFVTFLLHKVLPCDLWEIRNDIKRWNREKGSHMEQAEEEKKKKRLTVQTVKSIQSAGRLLISLVLRPGEGRKRVITDLIFALSGGRLGHGSTTDKSLWSSEVAPPCNEDLYAILVWGELCLAIAAPKHNGKNLDGLSTLSLDNIRIMFECGAVHSLLYALHRVKVIHPLASNVYSVLFITLEILTRGSVSDAVANQVNKEPQSNVEPVAASKSINVGSSLEPMAREGVMDLEDTDARANLGADYGALVNVERNDMEDVDSQDYMLEVGIEREDDDRSLDDELLDDEDSDEGDSDESGDDSEEDDVDDEDMSEESDSVGESSDSNDVEDEAAWEVDNYDAVNHEDNEFEEEEEEGEEAPERLEDEEWTRIESNGGFVIGNGLPSRSGFVDAAEAMINSLFRHEDISNDALAEIEGTLGIRIMRGGNSRSGRSGGANIEPLAARIVHRHEGIATNGNNGRGTTETIPRVNQRSQPAVGYSGFGRSAIEVSSMEYVFGGPTVTGRNQNYDVTSTSQSDIAVDDSELTRLDLQVFPNGPAMVFNVRSHFSLHPMLCGVDLPPISSLVSDLFPNGIRASRQPIARSIGELTNAPVPVFTAGHVFPVSYRDAIRSSLPINGSSSGALGLTDDGLPVDGMVQEFSTALVGTFDDIARATSAHTDANANLNIEINSDGGRQLIDETSTSLEQNMHPSGFATAVDLSDQVATIQSAILDPSSATARGSVSDQISTTASNAISDQIETSSSQQIETGISINEIEDGEHVASSVAELHLTTESEETERQYPIDSIETNTVQVSALSNVDMRDNSSVNVSGQHEFALGENIDEGSNVRSAFTRDASPSGDIVHDVGANSSFSVPREDIPQLATENVATEAITSNGLICPPDVDEDVFHSLPLEMQQDCVNQYSATQELAAQLTGSTLDPEVLAALPEEMRREIIEQDRQERRIRAQEEGHADPSNAEEMDNASFLASLSPDLREEILLTADQEFLNSLPPGVVAEAHILRERASVTHRRHYETTLEGIQNRGNTNSGSEPAVPTQGSAVEDAVGLASRRRQRSGKLKVDLDRQNIVFSPGKLLSPFAVADIKVLFQAIYLLTPVQPPKLLQKIFFNLCSNATLREIVTVSTVCLLGEDAQGALSAVESLRKSYEPTDKWKPTVDTLFSSGGKFPPATFVGVSRDAIDIDEYDLRSASGSTASLAVNLPKSMDGGETDIFGLPSAIVARFMEMMLHLCKNPRVCVHLLSSKIRDTSSDGVKVTSFDRLLEMLENPRFSNSSNNLDALLTLFEAVLTPLSHISRPHGEDEPELPEKEKELAAAAGKEYIDVPQVVVSQRRLQLLCSILRMESCRDTSFSKVNTIIRRLCRVETNRGYVLAELASVAHALGYDALRDLSALRIRMDDAAARGYNQLSQGMDSDGPRDGEKDDGLSRSISSSVTLSSSTSESKLLRVLQTLQVLCNDSGDDNLTKKCENTVVVTDELAHLLRQLKFDDLWDELSNCLKVVQILEGVQSFEDTEQKVSEDLDANDDGSAEDVTAAKNKKLRNTAAGLLARFLPSIEAFFIANACATRPSPDSADKTAVSDAEIAIESLVGGHRMLEFVSTHRVLVNALIRNNYSLLEKGFRALVQVPRCRALLDFDVKRQWFKSQVRRLRQQASRRHGSLRLHIRRKSVFEDAYHQLQPRNADEMRGRLHVTFRNEEGVDAGGLSREFFGILAKEMFNPNYALFTSTEDGCTFQPNPNSMINPDHLSYFRFVGRVVGKAVADGYLLDAHFTRSLYKHMLGIQPTHHDMEAIDPDYYRNLKTILEFNLADIGLDLTFSIEDHSFGRSQVIDLLPNGRSVPVTEENKEEYVRLVCQHRMTTSIQSQIKSYLAGFYELVSLDLIAIFSPRELELLISGLPDIDVHDLKEHTDYVGWKSTDQEIIWFWNIVFGLNRNEKASFLQFVTGSSKVPLSGFAELQGMRGIQKFSIHKMSGKKGALMSAHTCFNSLDLPSYDNEDEMRQKFLFAINEGVGAFLFA